jgi:hypothetical protein
MALATRVACNEEGNGNRGKINGNEGGGRSTETRAMGTVMATAPTWAMVTALRLAGDEEGKGKGGKGIGKGNEGGRQGRGQGRQSNGNSGKGGRQSDSNGNKEGNVDGNKGGRRGRGEWQG